MGFLDDAKKKLTDAVNEHGDKIKEGLDKAGRTIDEKTDGKYSAKIERGTKAAGDALDGLRDDVVGPTGSSPDASPTPDPNAPATGDPSTAPGPPKDPANPTG